MSITKWVDELYPVPLYDILSGFKPGRVKRLVKWLLPRLDQKKDLPSDRLFDFFQPDCNSSWDSSQEKYSTGIIAASSMLATVHMTCLCTRFLP